MKGGGKYMHGKLKMLKERIKINGQDVSYHIDCIATAVLEVGHYINKLKTIILGYMLKSANTLMQRVINVAC